MISNWTVLRSMALVKTLDDRNGDLKRWAASDNAEVLASISINLNVEWAPGDETQSFQNGVPGSNLPLLPASQGAWGHSTCKAFMPATPKFLNWWQCQGGLSSSKLPRVLHANANEGLSKGLTHAHNLVCVPEREPPGTAVLVPSPASASAAPWLCRTSPLVGDSVLQHYWRKPRGAIHSQRGELLRRFGGGRPACCMWLCISAALLCKGRALRNKWKHVLI